VKKIYIIASKESKGKQKGVNNQILDEPKSLHKNKCGVKKKKKITPSKEFSQKQIGCK